MVPRHRRGHRTQCVALIESVLRWSSSEPAGRPFSCARTAVGVGRGSRRSGTKDRCSSSRLPPTFRLNRPVGPDTRRTPLDMCCQDALLGPADEIRCQDRWSGKIVRRCPACRPQTTRQSTQSLRPTPQGRVVEDSALRRATDTAVHPTGRSVTPEPPVNVTWWRRQLFCCGAQVGMRHWLLHSRMGSFPAVGDEVLAADEHQCQCSRDQRDSTRDQEQPIQSRGEGGGSDVRNRASFGGG